MQDRRVMKNKVVRTKQHTRLHKTIINFEITCVVVDKPLWDISFQNNFCDLWLTSLINHTLAS